MKPNEASEQREENGEWLPSCPRDSDVRIENCPEQPWYEYNYVQNTRVPHPYDHLASYSETYGPHLGGDNRFWIDPCNVIDDTIGDGRIHPPEPDDIGTDGDSPNVLKLSDLKFSADTVRWMKMMRKALAQFKCKRCGKYLDSFEALLWGDEIYSIECYNLSDFLRSPYHSGSESSIEQGTKDKRVRRDKAFSRRPTCGGYGNARRNTGLVDWPREGIRTRLQYSGVFFSDLEWKNFYEMIGSRIERRLDGFLTVVSVGFEVEVPRLPRMMAPMFGFDKVPAMIRQI